MILEYVWPWVICRRWQRPCATFARRLWVRCVAGHLRSSVCATHQRKKMPLAWILLRNLLACERGLVEGYSRALRKGGRSPRETELMTSALEVHQRHARILGERLATLGEPPP